jgi:probable F420-dependent oxidoreductase
MTIDGLGRFGVWRIYTRVTPEDAGVLEGLGYGTLWLGGSPGAELEMVEPLLEATENLTVGTSIVNIWASPAKQTAQAFHRIEQHFPGRFILGIGAGHREHTGDYTRPYDALAAYLDVLDEAGVPRERRALAALGPRVLKLARDRTAGALPYLTTPQHTREAREILGPDVLLAPEHKVVLNADLAAARAVGRDSVGFYFGLQNYVASLHRLGFTDEDLTAPGSDRVVDALALHGTADSIATALSAHLAAGADHVAVQPLGDDYLTTLRALSPVLGTA